MNNLVENKLAGFVDKKLNYEYNVKIARDDAGTRMLMLKKKVPLIKFWDNPAMFGNKNTKTYIIYLYVYENRKNLFVQVFLSNNAQFCIDAENTMMDKGSFIWNRFMVNKVNHTVESFLEEEVFPYLKNRI